MKELYLICNAHLDLAWLWETSEGMMEALSTYQIAADFCDEYKDFIFNHNEAVLYEWVEETRPALFKKIQELVKEGKWNVVGGSFLQPDCNLPSGEATVRQYLYGRKYFLEKFNSIPRTAFNVDSFGHSRGLVQILQKSGYDSYIICRPSEKNCPLPDELFKWIGYDGSEITCLRCSNSYESHRGEADKKIDAYMQSHRYLKTGIVLWGIGNHGGGPSRIDYNLIEKLRNRFKGEVIIRHAYPEEYFNTVDQTGLPEVRKSLWHHAVGCYTSQVRIKQKYRKLENLLFETEKICSSVDANGLMKYPKALIKQAERDMLFVQFHDIITGSCISETEESACRQIDHGLEILENIMLKAFVALLDGEERAADGSIPVFAYNPHPFTVSETLSCEFNLPDQNKDSSIWIFPRVYQNGRPIPCQVEHESSNFNVDWRKRVVFYAALLPSQINRFECRLERWASEPELRPLDSDFIFKTDTLDVIINASTGAMDRYAVNGTEYLTRGSFIPQVMSDDYDSWGNTTSSFNKNEGCFSLMPSDSGTLYSGISDLQPVNSVRLIEDGEVRSVVEAVMQYNTSSAVIRYYLPKYGSEIKITVKVFWNEKMKMLKLPLKSTFSDATVVGQEMFGEEVLQTNGTESVAQKWVKIISADKASAFVLINNGTYGYDYHDNTLYASLLRSPGYSAGCSDFSRRKAEVMEQSRCNDFIDQGERIFTFWLNAGNLDEISIDVNRFADIKNEEPFVMSCFPSGTKKEVKPLIIIDNPQIQLAAFKKSEYNDNYVIRLFECTGKNAKGTITLPVFGFTATVNLVPYEIGTYAFNPVEKTFKEIPLLEKEY